MVCLLIPTLARSRDLNAYWHTLLFQTPAAATLQSKAQRTRGFGPISLHWRLNRAPILWWALSIISTGVGFFALIGEMDSLVQNSPQSAKYMAEILGDMELSRILVRMMGTLLGVFIGCAAIQTALAAHRSEHDGTLSFETTCGGSRHRPLLVNLGISLLASTAIVAVLAPLSTQIVAWSVRSELGPNTDTSEVSRATMWTIIDQLPAVIALIGLAALCVGISSRSSWLAWVIIACSGVITYFGDLFKFPEWVQNASVFAWPAHEHSTADFTGAIFLTILGLAAAALGVALHSRRDLVSP